MPSPTPLTLYRLRRNDTKEYFFRLKYVGGRWISHWVPWDDEWEVPATFHSKEKVGNTLAEILRTEPQVAKHISIVTFVNQETR